ncbi:MAG: hypothetical protein H7Y31_09255 [Chitinophagaceae bacterium]|nr:hypothetical protein [Chitinophagaceae bacterium]
MSEKEYVLQEIESEDELEQFLRLRYEVFFNSDAEMFISENDQQIDLNYYDHRSHHYGLYHSFDGVKKRIGYFRIVVDKRTMADQWVANISRRVGLRHLAGFRPRSTLPCFNAYPDANLEEKFYSRKEIFGNVGEASRLMIATNERSLKLSLQLLKMALAIGVMYVEHAFVGCFQEHSKAYSRLGFEQMSGTSLFQIDLPNMQKKGMIMYCRTKDLSNDMKRSLRRIQVQFVKDKVLRFSA